MTTALRFVEAQLLGSFSATVEFAFQLIEYWNGETRYSFVARFVDNLFHLDVVMVTVQAETTHIADFVVAFSILCCWLPKTGWTAAVHLVDAHLRESFSAAAMTNELAFQLIRMALTAATIRLSVGNLADFAMPFRCRSFL